MTGNHELDSQRPTSRQADALRRAVANKFTDGLPPSELFAQLTTEAGRAELVDLLIAAAVPNAPDGARWLRWFSGGAAPHIDDGLLDDDESNGWDVGLRHPRTREKQSVGRLASEKVREVGRIDADIAKAEEHVAELRRKREHADAIGRAAVTYGLFDALSKKLWPVFALGPAYTLMRAVSDHVVGKRALEANGGVCEKGVIAQVYATGDAGKVRDVLADLVGDVDFERELYEAVKAVTERHAKRTVATSAERQERRRRLAIADVSRVVGHSSVAAPPNSGIASGLLDF